MRHTISFILIFSLPFLSFGQETTKADTTTKKSVRIGKKSSPLMLLDNSILHEDSLKNIDPNTIGEIQVIKPDNDYAIKKYGEKAKDGIVIIKTKKLVAKEWFIFFNLYAKSKELESIIENEDFNYTEYKIILNGKELETDFFAKFKLTEDEVRNIKFKKLNSDKSGFKGMIIIKTNTVNAYIRT